MDGDALDCGYFQDGLHFLKSGTGIVIRLERRAATVYAASAAGQAWRMGFPGFFTALGTRAASCGGVAKMPAFFASEGAGNRLFDPVPHNCYFYPIGDWGGEG